MNRQVFGGLSFSFRSVVLVLCIHTLIGGAKGDNFGSGANSFEIEFVTIGNPGNPPDTTDRPVTDGAVPYRYRIGKYEVSDQMIEKANASSAAAGTPLNITHDGRGGNLPARWMTWFEAARFVNWLNTSTGAIPAYKFDSNGNFELWEITDPGYDAANLYRNKLATYFLPSLHEWYKAAYYDPVLGVYYDYPTGSDSVPDGIDFAGDPIFDAVYLDDSANDGPNEITNVGLLSPYGTAGQGGNVMEWLESAVDRVNDSPMKSRGLRGGGWQSRSSEMLASDRLSVGPTFQDNSIGFRVASIIPEPSTFLLLSAAFIVVIDMRRPLRPRIE